MSKKILTREQSDSLNLLKIIKKFFIILLFVLLFIFNFPFKVQYSINAKEIDLSDSSYLKDRVVLLDGMYKINLLIEDRFYGKIEIYDDENLLISYTADDMKVSGGWLIHYEMYDINLKLFENYDYIPLNVDADRFLKNPIFFIGSEHSIAHSTGICIVPDVDTFEEALDKIEYFFIG